jgi:photosystem II stability/assembly factor-like uncharacterized protein
MRLVIWVRRLLGLSLFVASQTVLAGENVWTTNGPPGWITALAVGPSGVFAGAYVDGRNVGFRSVDHGASWTVIGEVPVYWSISAFSFDSVSPTRVFAAANLTLHQQSASEIYRSDDGGNHWAAVASLREYVLHLVFRPDRPGTLYGGLSSCTCPYPCRLSLTCTAEIRKSADFGVTWGPAGTGVAGSAILGLALDPVDPNRVYAAGWGVFVSTDAGDHWSAVNAGLECPSVLALAIRPSDGSLFAGTAYAFADRFGCGGVFRSDDGGQSWRTIGLSSYYVTSLAIDPTDPQTIYAGTSAPVIGFFSPDGGVFRSEDGGETWAPFGLGLPPRGVDRLVIESSGLRLHASTSEGVFDYEIVPGARPPVIPPRTRGTRTLPARP